MQPLSSNAKTLVTLHACHRLEMEITSGHAAPETRPAGSLQHRFGGAGTLPSYEFQAVYEEPLEEYAALEGNYKRWRLLAAWTGLALGSWGAVIGAVFIARTLVR